jgi:osmoprotectant transport system permease protein
VTLWRYLQTRADDLLVEALQHIALVLGAVALATVICLALGVAVQHRRLPSAASLAVASTIFTIPSLALVGLLLPLLGLGWRPALVALVLYSLLPILRNTLTGLRGVDAAMLEAARGMGLGPGWVLWRIQLPLAWPVILTGIRVAAQVIIGIAALAAFVGGPGLGGRIFTGLSRLGSANALNDALAGTLGVVVVALLVDGMFMVLARATTSRGIRVHT